ncbi:hypothetical protein [Nonomuraea sp. 10N515B]|uniref:hypothetical protein n=1 Tax=Nonomuraea sp. 10N515B TaxID=3457422 RepID=UPI003FCCC550
MIHACWIDWYTNLLQTQALLAVAGAEDVSADPHAAFADAYGTAPKQDREERRQMIEALIAAAG